MLYSSLRRHFKLRMPWSTGLHPHVTAQYTSLYKTYIASAQLGTWKSGGHRQIHRRNYSLLGVKNRASCNGEGHDLQSNDSDIPHTELPVELQGLSIMHLSSMHEESDAFNHAERQKVLVDSFCADAPSDTQG